jgi:hypothetical protein
MGLLLPAGELQHLQQQQQQLLLLLLLLPVDADFVSATAETEPAAESLATRNGGRSRASNAATSSTHPTLSDAHTFTGYGSRSYFMHGLL